MSDLAEKIARFLDVKIDPRQTTYYSLLGLKEGESDTVQIGASLKRAFDRLKATKSNEDIKNWEQVARLVQQIQSVLLDPAKKAAYDQKLQSAKTTPTQPSTPPASPGGNDAPKSKNGQASPPVPQSKTAKPAAATVQSSEQSPKQSPIGTAAKPAMVSRPAPPELPKVAAVAPAPIVTTAQNVAVQEKPSGLIGLLPQEDPNAPFDFPAFVREQSQAPAELESVEDRLSALKFLLQKDIRRGGPPALARDGLDSPAKYKLPKSPSMSQKARLSQRLSISSGVLTLLMLLGAGGVVAFGWWMVKTPKKSTIAQKDNVPEKVIVRPAPKPVDQPAEPVKNPKPTTSTLPAVGAAADEDKAARAQAMIEDSARKMREDAAASMAAEKDAQTEPMENTPDPNMSTPATDPPPDMAVELTAEEKATLTASLNAARDALPKQDFATFHAEMEKALTLARSKEDSVKYKRLNQLGLLHEQFVQAFQDGLKGLKSTSEIKVGTSVVAVVEIKPNAILIQDKGKTVEHPFDKIPVALALGIADLALDKEKPIDVAARGVFCLVHPSRTKLNETKGKSLIEQAIPSEEILDDLLEALTDTY
jgi:hypothetical protein